jgi:N6-adenosine-specific RNA methylase IME4
MTGWPFGHLRPLSYGMIMADPPWHFELRSEKGAKKSAAAQYETMSDEVIAALPVNMLARGDAVLWLWATAPKLDVAFQVMRAWGFRYRSFGAWDKARWGTGYVLRSVCEPYLIGTIGKPALDGRNIPNIIRGGAREHSRKPDEAFRIAERLAPREFRCELFSRQSRHGWDAWGSEASKFDDVRRFALNPDPGPLFAARSEVDEHARAPP